jgi:hypothetical protein
MNNFDDLLNTTPDGRQPKEQPQRLSNEEYAQKKQAEREALFETSDEAALKVASNGDAFKNYLDVQTRLGRYSAVNALLIMEAKPEASRLGDFDFWKDKGGFIKADEKGIPILEPNEYTKDDGSIGIGYNVKKVFDISQVDTRKIKTEPSQTYDSRQLLTALIHKAPMAIRSADEIPNGGGAMTDPQTGDIIVLKGMAFGDAYRSVAHELSLAEVDREKVKDARFTAYCASYILCKKHGVETKGYNFDSVAAILKDMEPKDIKSELTQIRNAADEISGRMARQLGAAQKAARSQEAR